MHLARFPRRRYTPSWTPLEKLERLSGAARRPRPLHQARRSARARRRRQQDPQARIPRRRRPGAGRGHARHLRRGAVEPLPADTRGGRQGRPEVPPRPRGARGQQLQPRCHRQQLPLPPARRRGGHGGEDRRGPRGGDAEGGGRGGVARAQGVRHPRRRLEPARRTRLRVLRRGDPRPDVRSRRSPRSHRLRERQHRHPRGTARRPRRQQQPHPGHRHQRAAHARGAGAERPQAGAGRSRACSTLRAACRATPSRRSATGWAPATRCPRRRWWRR